MDAPFLSWRLRQARLKGAPTPSEVKYLVFDGVGAAFVEMLVDYAVRKKPIGDLLETG